MSGSYHVAVVGAGPAGVFATDALLKNPQLEVDVFERLVAPYGLVRYGVAPDHQKIKGVQAGFAKTLGNDRVRYFGNVELGRDLTVDDLRKMYDQVVFAMGCESPRKLGVDGENARGIHSALEIVSWYNAHPNFVNAQIDLAVEHVAIVGAGDVSMDLSRLLCSSADELKATDMPDYAVEEFAKLNLKTIDILIRRGPANANFALKELRAVVERDNVRVSCDAAMLEETLATDLPNAQRAKLEYLLEHVRKPSEGEVEVRFRFLRSPVEFQQRDGKLHGVVVEKNCLVPREDGSVAARGTGEHETLQAELALLAVGYRGSPIPGVELDARSGLIPNTEGRVTLSEGQPDPQCYVVGWLKRGPQGVIGTNKGDAKATVAHMLDNLPEARRPAPRTVELLRERGVEYVSFADWTVLDNLERQRGSKLGKPRVKFVEAKDALATLKQHASNSQA